VSFTENYTIAYESINLKITFCEHLEYMSICFRIIGVIQQSHKSSKQKIDKQNGGLAIFIEDPWLCVPTSRLVCPLQICYLFCRISKFL